MLSNRAFADAVIRFGEKFDRGGKHLDALNESAQRFAERHGGRGILCRTQSNSQATKCVIRVEQVPKRERGDAVQWGVIVGDSVHCWRSALDQFAAALWAEKLTTSSGFPICLTEREWVTEAPRMIWSIPEECVAIIERAQPYHRGDKEQARGHPLAVLHSLWNLDKHRTIPATDLILRNLEILKFDAPGLRMGEWKPKIGAAIKPNAVIAEAKILAVDKTRKADVDMDARLRLGVAFGDGGELPEAIRSKPVVKTFHNFIAPAMASILRDFHDIQHGKPLSEPWLAPKPSEVE